MKLQTLEWPVNSKVLIVNKSDLWKFSFFFDVMSSCLMGKANLDLCDSHDYYSSSSSVNLRVKFHWRIGSD